MPNQPNHSRPKRAGVKWATDDSDPLAAYMMAAGRVLNDAGRGFCA